MHHKGKKSGSERRRLFAASSGGSPPPPPPLQSCPDVALTRRKMFSFSVRKNPQLHACPGCGSPGISMRRGRRGGHPCGPWPGFQPQPGPEEQPGFPPGRSLPLEETGTQLSPACARPLGRSKDTED